MTSAAHFGSTNFTVHRMRVTVTRWDAESDQNRTSDQIGYIIHYNGRPVHFCGRVLCLVKGENGYEFVRPVHYQGQELS